MSQVLAEAEFLQTDITYNQSAQYPYLFNAAVFNEVTMEWMVVARVWLDNQSQQGYKLAFKKMFDTCRENHPDFELGNSLGAIVLDWSDAKINGLKEAIGDKLATSLVKGFKVHWMRSCQKVANKVASPQNKEQEKSVFLRIARKIQTLNSAIESIACFEALCGVQTVTQLLEKLPNICTLQEAKQVDASKDWSSARNWAQWWTRSTHLKMLCAAFTEMETRVWHQSPTKTNAVERKNRDCKSDAKSMKQIMMDVYKIDKVVCMKHISAQEGSSITYRSRTMEARAAEAKARQKRRFSAVSDKNIEFGPPDKVTNFNKPASCKRKPDQSPSPSPAQTQNKKSCIEIENQRIEFVPDKHPETIGKKARMKFHIAESDSDDKCEWFFGVVSSYDGIQQKYGIYFPCDGETVYASLDDEDLEIID